MSHKNTLIVLLLIHPTQFASAHSSIPASTIFFWLIVRKGMV
jgi:hypothetical protein